MRAAGPDDVSEAAEVLAEAFASDELSVAALGRPRNARGALRTVFTSLLRHHYVPRGIVDLAVRDGRVVGAAAWSRPGENDLRLGEFGALAVDLVPALGWRVLPAASYAWRTDRVHPRPPHWYLYAIGVRMPGRGVGGILLDHALARAGGVPSYCEASTPDSARLYERKGFRRIGEAPTPRGCPPQPQLWHPGGRPS
ncbi:putative acetyltransferase [Mobilicoccus pelagius NBRC 104925]|uniref:Putative acetyltransferase n=1 Tax=Mobilicoccus pelagius NBRC 104925 TaxID=1089455 RepID=H5UT12_9MICO|nr:putative acetyltransferase [Mobilicoccus pelagius NBRC 104925]